MSDSKYESWGRCCIDLHNQLSLEDTYQMFKERFEYEQAKKQPRCKCGHYLAQEPHNCTVIQTNFD